MYHRTLDQNKRNNSLHNREECPHCRNVFISGFNEDNIKKCPSCKQKFVTKAANRGTNNVYYNDGCPALMSDGRFITYHNSTNELTESMRKLNGIRSPNQFRNFLQKNADLFMNAERNHITKENTCSPATACSQGWYDLWEKNNGNWANFEKAPRAYNDYN